VSWHLRLIAELALCARFLSMSASVRVGRVQPLLIGPARRLLLGHHLPSRRSAQAQSRGGIAFRILRLPDCWILERELGHSRKKNMGNKICLLQKFSRRRAFWLLRVRRRKLQGSAVQAFGAIEKIFGSEEFPSVGWVTALGGASAMLLRT